MKIFAKWLSWFKKPAPKQTPIGEILVSAGMITPEQLAVAVQLQKEKGGYLGDVITSMQLISPETLRTFLSLQKSIRNAAQTVNVNEGELLLGDILVKSGTITAHQLETAVAYQKEMGGYLGEALISTKCISKETLNMYLELQKAALIEGNRAQ